MARKSARTVSVTGGQLSVSTSEGDTQRQAQQAAASSPLDGLTPAQAAAWLDANVTDLNSARTAIKHMVRLLFVLRADVAREKVRRS